MSQPSLFDDIPEPRRKRDVSGQDRDSKGRWVAAVDGVDREFTQFLTDSFIKWLPNNWHVYAAFEKAAFRAINAGRTHFSARTIIHDMRDYSRVSENGEKWKINDHHSPYLARLFVIKHPRYRNLWEYRRRDWQEFLSALPPMEEGDE